jgi:hypothetical protein
MKFLVFLIIAYIPTLAYTQSQDVRDTRELLQRYEKEGQLFTVKIIPQSKNIEVFVTGHKTADLKFTDVGLEAYALIGSRKMNLNVTRDANKGTFNVTRHTTVPFTLKLQLKQNEKTEQLRFDVR